MLQLTGLKIKLSSRVTSILSVQRSSLLPLLDPHQKEKPSAIPRALVPYSLQERGLCQERFDAIFTPVIRLLMSEQVASRKFLFSSQISPCTGAQIARILLQFRQIVPLIASLPREVRVGVPLRLQIGERDFFIKVNEIPLYLQTLYEQMPCLEIPSPEEEEKGVLVDPYTIQEAITPSSKQVGSSWLTGLRTWFWDLGHPEGEKKCLYSLFGVQRALDQQFPKWSKNILPALQAERKNSLFAEKALLTLQALQGIVKEEKDIESRYFFIFSHLQQALQSAPKEPNALLVETQQLLEYICHFHLTEGYPYPFLEDFLFKALRAPQERYFPYELKELTTLEKLAEEIEEAHRRLMTVPSDYRPSQRLGNCPVPWVHSLQELQTRLGKRVCKVLSQATPMAERLEYQAHLSIKPEKVTLYCDQQSKVVRELQEKYANFYVLSLPLEGPIWRSLRQSSVEDLKQKLFTSLVKQTEGFAFPQRLNIEEHQGAIQALLKRVHQLYFQGREALSLSEAQVYLLLFYSVLKDYVKGFVGADYVISLDHEQGAVSSLTDRVKNLVLLGEENSPEALHEAFVLSLAPFAWKGRSILPKSLSLSLEVIRHLARLTAEEKETIRKEAQDLSRALLAQSVPKEPVSWAQMVSASRFKQWVEHMRDRGEKRVFVDRHLLENVRSTYLKQGEWDLPNLQKQIEKDLVRWDFRLNEERIFSFPLLCQRLGFSLDFFQTKTKMDHLSDLQNRLLTFMCLMQQGVMNECFVDPSVYLNGNAQGWVVGQAPLGKKQQIVINLIGQARQNLAQAKERALKLSQDKEIASSIRRAIQRKFLPVNFLSPGEESATPLYSTRIHVKIDSQEYLSLDAEQDLELRQPGEEGGYSILAKLYVRPGIPAKISWEFVGSI